MTTNNRLQVPPPAAVRTMILHVPQNRDRLPKRLNDTINRCVDTSLKRRFCNASKADPRILAGLLTPKVERNRDVRTVIVQAWLALHPRVLEQVDATLKQHSNSPVTIDNLAAWSREFAAQHEDESAEEATFVFQMRAADSGISVIPSDNAQGQLQGISADGAEALREAGTAECTAPRTHVAADEFLEQLEQLGPDHPFWDSVPEFTTAIAALHERKIYIAARAEIKAREMLKTAWVELGKRCTEPVAFFSIPAFCFDEITSDTETIIAAIARLQSALERFWQLYVDRPASAEAYRKNRTLLDAAESEVAHAVEHLRSLIPLTTEAAIQTRCTSVSVS